MAALLTRSLVSSVVSPLLNLSRVVAKPRSFSACLLGTLRGASPRPEARWLPWGRPQQPLLQQPAQGFKTKGTLKKRCRDCYRVKRRGRWFIYCKTNPRHKQRQM